MTVINLGFGMAAMQVVIRIGTKKFLAMAALVELLHLLELVPQAQQAVAALLQQAATTAHPATRQQHLETKNQS
jgi:hypothetical protein